MPVLTTARLTCSPLHEQDWPFFSRYSTIPPSCALWRKTALWQRSAPRSILVSSHGRRAAHWLCLTVRDTDSQAPLGITGYIHREEDCAEVGFLFAPAAHGKGYGFESLRALCDYAFLQGGIRRLTATVTAGNIASKRVLEKTGFQLEGELRENYYLGGQWQNDWLFGLLKHEYLNNNP
ncbi:GNAT family N-acetyltransferase [Enterobacter mori]